MDGLFKRKTHRSRFTLGSTLGLYRSNTQRQLMTWTPQIQPTVLNEFERASIPFGHFPPLPNARAGREIRERDGVYSEWERPQDLRSLHHVPLTRRQRACHPSFPFSGLPFFEVLLSLTFHLYQLSCITHFFTIPRLIS